MSFFSTPRINLVRRSQEALVVRIGADSSPYILDEILLGNGFAAIYSLKTTGFPVWGYFEQYNIKKSPSIWLYLAQAGIPIYSPGSGRWTSVSKYVTQMGDPTAATIFETADVSKGGVVSNGGSLYASDTLGVSEVELSAVDGLVTIKAGKGLVRVVFDALGIQQSLVTAKSGLTMVESKTLPLPPPTPVASTPPGTVAPKSSTNWLAVGSVAAVATAAVLYGRSRS